MSDQLDKARKLLAIARDDPASPQGQTAAKQAGLIIARHDLLDQRPPPPPPPPPENDEAYLALRSSARALLHRKEARFMAVFYLVTGTWGISILLWMICAIFFSSLLAVLTALAYLIFLVRWTFRRLPAILAHHRAENALGDAAYPGQPEE